MSLIQGDQTREFSALRQGVIDMGRRLHHQLVAQVKQLNLFSLPFLMPDYAAIDAGRRARWARKCSRPLTGRAWCPGLGRKRLPRAPTQAPDQVAPPDMKGLKIRASARPVHRHLHRPGANPTQMSWADAQPAFASGAVDARRTPVAHQAAKLHTVAQKHITGAWGYVKTRWCLW